MDYSRITAPGNQTLDFVLHQNIPYTQCGRGHTHHPADWPSSGEITIEKCERQCRFPACKAWSQTAAALRKHVNKHIQHNKLLLKVVPSSNGRESLKISVEHKSIPLREDQTQISPREEMSSVQDNTNTSSDIPGPFQSQNQAQVILPDNVQHGTVGSHPVSPVLEPFDLHSTFSAGTTLETHKSFLCSTAASAIHADVERFTWNPSRKRPHEFSSSQASSKRPQAEFAGRNRKFVEPLASDALDETSYSSSIETNYYPEAYYSAMSPVSLDSTSTGPDREASQSPHNNFTHDVPGVLANKRPIFHNPRPPIQKEDNRSSIPSGIFLCIPCEKLFKSRVTFDRHNRVHGKPFLCERLKCRAKFQYARGLERHKKEHAPLPTRRSCDIPGSNFEGECSGHGDFVNQICSHHSPQMEFHKGVQRVLISDQDEDFAVPTNTFSALTPQKASSQNGQMPWNLDGLQSLHILADSAVGAG